MIDKSSKGVSSRNIHLFTHKGVRSSTARRRVAGGVCWMRRLNDSDDDDDVCLKKAGK
jgi:hypothetical protein